MIKLLGLFLLLFTVHAFAQQPTNCSKFHEGKFKMLSTVYGKNYFVTRTEKYQTEQEEGSDEVNVYRIKWISDCSYTLKPYKVSAEIKKVAGKKLLLVEITEVDGDKYTCSAGFKEPGAQTVIAHLEKINQ
jgi:hypothetical protein